MKKIISLALTFSIILSMSINSFAYSDSPKSVDVSGMTLYSVSEEVIYVEDGEGNTVALLLEECTYVPNNGIALYSYVAEYPVGTIKTYSVKITNEQLGVPWTVKAIVSDKGKDALSNLAGKAVGEALAGKLMSGLNLVARIAAIVAVINIVFGNEGFNVTVTMKYDEYVSQREGYSIFGWEFNGVTVVPY